MLHFLLVSNNTHTRGHKDDKNTNKLLFSVDVRWGEEKNVFCIQSGINAL